MRPAPLIIFLGAAAATAAAGQASAEQAAEPASSVYVGTPSVAKTVEAPTQISRKQDSDAAQAQLTSEGASDDATTQLAGPGPSVEASEALSTPSDGRTAGVERVGGSDRCDPANAERMKSAECGKVIETRAGDYSRPSPTELSPEQRLLIAQQWGPNAPEAAASRLAKSGSTGDDADGLGIASVVLQQSEPAKSDEQKPADDPAANPAVQALIQVLTQGTPN